MINTDVTYCPFYIECKKGFDCSRAYCQTVQESEAVVYVYSDHPDCFDGMKKKGRPAQIKEDKWWEEM